MVCSRLGRRLGPAPIWHRFWCPQCRRARRLDSLVAFALACRRAEPAPLDRLYALLQALQLPLTYRPGWRACAVTHMRRCWRPLAATALVAAGAGYGYLRWIDIDPNVTTPARTMPSPNAWTYFCRASKMLVDAGAISSIPSPEDCDAAWRKHVKEAAGSNPAQASSRSPATGPSSTPAPVPSRDLNEKLMRMMGNASPEEYETVREQVLRENTGALRMAREGFQFEYMAPPKPTYPQMADDRYGFMQIGMLFRIESEVYTAHGQWSRAAASALDAIKLGVLIEQHSDALDTEMGTGCEWNGRKALWSVLGHLTSGEASAAGKRLEALDAERPPLYAALAEEEWATVDRLQLQMRQPAWRTRPIFLCANGMCIGLDLMERLRLLQCSKRQLLVQYRARMAQAIGLAHMSFAQAAPYLRRTPDRSNVNDFLDGSQPDFGFFNFIRALRDTQVALLRAALALRAYYAEHGQYPDTLESVVATTDPFAPYSQPLRYMRKGASYLLYSVGPDCVDDAGNAIGGQRGSAEAHLAVNLESKGDIVAGVNTD